MTRPISAILRVAVSLICVSAVWAADAPLFEDIHAVALPKGEYGYRSMPGTMAILNDGRILLAYTHYTPEGKGDGAIGAKYSTDKGKSWGDEFILVPAPLPVGSGVYCHPSLLRLKNGQLMLSYIYVSPAEYPHFFGGNYYRRSIDDGKTWGDQLVMTPRGGYNIMHNDKLVQLSTGRLIVPVETEVSFVAGDHAGYVSLAFNSDDNGYSWHESSNMVKALPVEAQEPHVVELKDGRVLMLMRTYSGYVLRSISADKGETWSPGEPIKELPLPPQSSALNIKRIPSTGDLVLIRCNAAPAGNARYRSPMTSIISKDDGATWSNERVIAGEPDNDYGYPGLTFVDDIALIAYHTRDGLHVARIGVDWFYAK